MITGLVISIVIAACLGFTAGRYGLSPFPGHFIVVPMTIIIMLITYSIGLP